MAKSKPNKTTENEGSVTDFINAVEDETKRSDCFKVIEIFKKQTKLEPKMWGPAIVGFGTCHYKYESGREGDAPLVAFSPRKNEIVLYLASEFEKRDELLKEFGKHKTGKSCIYIKKLTDVKTDVLKQMITNSIKHSKASKSGY